MDATRDAHGDPVRVGVHGRHVRGPGRPAGDLRVVRPDRRGRPRAPHRQAHVSSARCPWRCPRPPRPGGRRGRRPDDELGAAQAGADEQPVGVGDPLVDEDPPAGGESTGVMPPYSMPDSSTARSIDRNEALRTSSSRLTAPLTSARVLARTTHAAMPFLTLPLARDDDAVRRPVERDAGRLDQGRGVGEVGIDVGDPRALRQDRPDRLGEELRCSAAGRRVSEPAARCGPLTGSRRG